MQMKFTRILVSAIALSMVGASANITVFVPSAFADVDDHKKKTIPKKTKKTSRKDQENEIKRLQKELKSCKYDGDLYKTRWTVQQSAVERLEKEHGKLNDQRVNLKNKISKDKKTSGQLTRTLRSGKSSTGKQLTLKDKDKLVGEINKLNQSVRKDEIQLKEYDSGARSHRKEIGRAQRHAGNAETAFGKQTRKCKAIEDQIKKMK
jgi:chromosome segregation ATPase